MDYIAASLTLLAIAGLTLAAAIWRFSIKAYLYEKGKNLATKEDIARITELVEGTKASVNRLARYDQKKYELKYEACLSALRIVDAQLSHVMTTDNAGKAANIVKQSATAEQVRSCHNSLVLTVDNPDIVRTYLDILAGGPKHPMVALDDFRALIRKELGFEGTAHSDQERTWLGKGIPGEA